MDLSCPFGLLGKEVRRRRIVLNQNQKDTLRAWFEKNPNPDLATRGLLAKELGISESQIMTWFQKHRKIQKQVEFGYCFEESQAQGQDKPKVKEAGRSRTHFTKLQIDVLIEAFKKNRFPGIATREKLAQETGIPESRIHIWFQNRRARHPDTKQGTQATAQLPRNSQCPALKTIDQPALKTIDQPALKTIDQPALKTTHQPALKTIDQPALKTAHQPALKTTHQPALKTIDQPALKTIDQPALKTIDQPALKTAHQPAPSTPLTSSLSVTAAFSLPDTQSGPLDLSRGGQKQLSSTTALQPSQVVQGKGASQSSSVFNGHLPPVITPGREDFHPQAPLWLPIQERCQDPSEDSGLAVPPLDDSTQAPAVNQLDQKDFAFLQHWDEWFQSMLAEWIPDKEYWSPGKSELHPWPTCG